MEKKIIYLIRHGQIQSNIDDVYAGRNGEKLTDDAVGKAEKLGRKMRDMGISRLCSSPVVRTLQTSEILNKHLHAELVVDSDLIEMDLGPWTGLSKMQVAAAYPEAFHTWTHRPSDFKMDGMETLREIQERMVRSMLKILRGNVHEVNAVVTHAVIIKSAFLYFNGLPLDAYHEVAVSNLSVHELVFGNDKSFVKKVF